MPRNVNVFVASFSFVVENTRDDTTDYGKFQDAAIVQITPMVGFVALRRSFASNFPWKRKEEKKNKNEESHERTWCLVISGIR